MSDVSILFSIFYVVPIALWTWFLGRGFGWVASILCLGLWIAGDYYFTARDVRWGVVFWNAGVIFCFFIIILLTLDALKKNFVQERKNNAVLLRSYEDIKKLMDIKSRFVAMASHEIRTPLAAMTEAAELIEKKTEGLLDAQQKRLLEIMRSSTDRLLRLVNEMLDFSKTELGTRQFHIDKHLINQSVREAVDLYEPIAKKKSLTLTCELDDRIPETYYDADSVAQVLSNLIHNAIKCTEEGTVTVRTQLSGPRVMVAVQDTGYGIAEEDMDKVFQPFQLFSHGGHPSIAGAGLGLVISKQLIERQQGKIGVVSRPGKGTQFYFSLPLRVRM
jgi:signal transduction histidine kinase